SRESVVKPADLKFKSAKRLLFGQTTKDQYVSRTKIPKQESTLTKHEEPAHMAKSEGHGWEILCSRSLSDENVYAEW
ncbi:hypothetical protein Tco_0432913, partial [Tanacetum coccineum]